MGCLDTGHGFALYLLWNKLRPIVRLPQTGQHHNRHGVQSIGVMGALTVEPALGTVMDSA